MEDMSMMGLGLLAALLGPRDLDRDDGMVALVLLKPLVEPECLTGRGNICRWAITGKGLLHVHDGYNVKAEQLASGSGYDGWLLETLVSYLLSPIVSMKLTP